MSAPGPRARVLAIASGKGGVGKTSLAVNLSIALAGSGSSVVLLDADLGLANVEVLLGLNSLYTLEHVVRGERGVLEVLVEGPGGILLVPGCSGIAQVADLGRRARQNVLDGLEELQRQSDYLIIDTMAGIGQNAMAFTTAADEVLIVTTPEPSAIVDAYATCKTVYQHREDAVVSLVVNQAVNEAQAQAVSLKINRVAQLYLGRKLELLGYIPRDPHVSRAVMQTTPLLLRYPEAAASQSIVRLARSLLQGAAPSTGRPGFFRRFAEHLGLAPAS